MDPITVSIGTGLIVSLTLTELFGLAAGGMVVPGYLALFLDRPMVVVLTLGAACLTWGIVRGISQFAIVYGKRRTALMILVGFLVGFTARALIGWLAASTNTLEPGHFQIVGYIVPGLIAIWMERQGITETCCVVLTASAMVRLLLIASGVEVIA